MIRAGIDARLTGYRTGGINEYIRGLLRGLATLETEDQFVVFTSRRRPPSLLELPARFRQVGLYTPAHHHFEQLVMPWELVPYGIDVLHSPDFIPLFYRRCAAVVTIHDLAFVRWPELLTPESRQYYEQVFRAVRSAQRVIAVSDSTRADVIELLGAREERVVTVHSGVDETCRPIDDPDALRGVRERFKLEGPFFLFVGTVEPRKNLPGLFKGYKRWKERGGGGGARLVIAGPPGWLYRESYKAADELGLVEDVKFLGAVNREDKVLLYNAALGLVLPSLYEGFGFPALEAMACGTPVIVSAVSSLPEIVGGAGILAHPEDIEGWASALERVAGDERLRAELRRKGLAQAARFSWAATAARTAQVYRESYKV